MQSIKNNVEDFLKSNPDCRSFLHELIENEEEMINKETGDYQIENTFEKAKALCEYDVARFKKSVLPGFKYKLELLKTNNPDYKLLESSIEINDNLDKEHSRCLVDIKQNAIELKIYRIVPNDKTTTKSTSRSQTLLLHGTKAPSVEGILKTGFNPSQKGSFGPGVYLTNNFSYAYDYGKSFATNEKMIRKFRYFFVNAVEISNKDLFRGGHSKPISFQDYLSSKPSVQIFGLSRKNKNTAPDLFDSLNRKIMQGTFQTVLGQNTVLAHHSLVVPAYLIEIEEKTSVDDVVNGTLYSGLKLEKLKKGYFPTLSQKTNIRDDVSQISFTMIAEELKKGIKSHYEAKLSQLTVGLRNKTDSIIKQLSFKFSSIFELEKDKKRKYSTELLQKENDDYKFILRSFSNENMLKIKQLFRINPNDENEVDNLKQKYLYLNVVERDQVKDILTNGYPKDPEDSDPDICYSRDYSLITATTSLGMINFSYFQVDNAVKKLLLVFVSAYAEGRYHKLKFKDSKVIRDSRGSLAAEGLFCCEGNRNIIDVVDCVPAYVIVFELE